jgi:hypothetical protein
MQIISHCYGFFLQFCFWTVSTSKIYVTQLFHCEFNNRVHLVFYIHCCRIVTFCNFSLGAYRIMTNRCLTEHCIIAGHTSQYVTSLHGLAAFCYEEHKAKRFRHNRNVIVTFCWRYLALLGVNFIQTVFETYPYTTASVHYKTKRLVPFRKIDSVYFENHSNHINTLCW